MFLQPYKAYQTICLVSLIRMNGHTMHLFHFDTRCTYSFISGKRHILVRVGRVRCATAQNPYRLWKMTESLEISQCTSSDVNPTINNHSSLVFLCIIQINRPTQPYIDKLTTNCQSERAIQIKRAVNVSSAQEM